MRDKRKSIQRWAGACSLGAAAAHGSLVSEHLREWWGYGLVFVAAGLAQAVLGLALLTDAFRERDGTFRPGGARGEAALQWAGIVGTLLLVGLYVVTRTVGIPSGPQAGTVEEVAPIDVVTKALEVTVVVLLARLVRRRRAAVAAVAV
jgi:hypothetical protein